MNPLKVFAGLHGLFDLDEVHAVVEHGLHRCSLLLRSEGPFLVVLLYKRRGGQVAGHLQRGFEVSAWGRLNGFS